jgi:hypothetical protein
MTTIEITICVALLILVPAGLYGLHRFALYLEAQDLLYYMKKKPQSGWMPASFMPLQELLQPEVRHVVKVKDERQVADEAGDDDDPASEPDR